MGTKINKLTVISLNCRSIRNLSKRALLQAIIHEHQADIIFSYKSHLDSTYATTEVFPSEFSVFRKDYSNGGGGVFMMVRNSFCITEQPMFDGDAEMVWAKLTLSAIKPIYLCSFYRPPDGLKDPILQLKASLSKLYDKSSQLPNIILAGDF